MVHHDLLLRTTLSGDRRERIERYAVTRPLATRKTSKRATRRSRESRR